MAQSVIGASVLTYGATCVMALVAAFTLNNDLEDIGMKLTINIDCTPQEARTFFGMPDLEPLNKMIVDEMTRRAKDNMDTLADPERLIAAWISMGGKGLEGFQSLMGAAMSNFGDGSAKKK